MQDVIKQSNPSFTDVFGSNIQILPIVSKSGEGYLWLLISWPGLLSGRRYRKRIKVTFGGRITESPTTFTDPEEAV